MTVHTMAMIAGHRWYWYRARLCDVYSNDHPKMKRWFLRDDNDYVGDFATKREMLAWIAEQEGAR